MTTISSPQLDVMDPEDQVQPPVISRREYLQITAPQRDENEKEALGGGYMNIPMRKTEETSAAPKKRFAFLPAFWTVTSLISLVVNVILIAVLISVVGQLFSLKSVINTQLIGGLDTNFGLMDQARIKTTINVSTNVPAKFTLPLETDTSVTLTKDTQIKTAKVTLTTGGLQITNAPANIILPAGTQLPVHLELSVPVDQQIPVNLSVPVDIPLSQTDLHKPFVGLQGVVQPYKSLLDQVPGSWRELICGPKPSDFCKALVP